MQELINSAWQLLEFLTLICLCEIVIVITINPFIRYYKIKKTQKMLEKAFEELKKENIEKEIIKKEEK